MRCTGVRRERFAFGAPLKLNETCEPAVTVVCVVVVKPLGSLVSKTHDPVYCSLPSFSFVKKQPGPKPWIGIMGMPKPLEPGKLLVWLV